MMISFKGLVINCRELNTEAQYIRRGDYIELDGELYWVETIQRGCESINKYGTPFANWLLVNKDGKKIARRDIFGTQHVWRKINVRLAR